MPRIRSGVLLSAAVLLGVLGGAGTGYAVQYRRPPTPLPPFTVAQPKYPTARSTSDGRLPAAQDDMVRTDGDLTALLLPMPAGGQEVNFDPGMNGWTPLGDYVLTFDHPAEAIQTQLSDGFRRAASRSWAKGGVDFELELVQYRHESEATVNDDLEAQKNGALNDVGSEADTLVPPGSPDEEVYVGKQLKGGLYHGEAVGRHGDILVLLFSYGAHRSSTHALESILERQLERL